MLWRHMWKKLQKCMFNMQQLWFFLYIWWIKDLFLRLFIVDLICVRYKRRNGWRTTVVLMDFVDLFKIEISSSTIICLLWSVTSMTKGSGVNIINTQYASFLTSTVCDQKYFRCKKNSYIINQNHIFSNKYCEVISG